MNKLALTAGASLLVLLMGCASSPPTAADAMRDRAGASTDSANAWDKADALVTAGERQVEQGEQELRDASSRRQSADKLEREAKDRIVDGRNKIAEGTALKTSTEAAYEKTVPQPRTTD